MDVHADAGEGTSRMRYLTGVLRPVERTHPIERALAEDPALTPVAIHQNRLHDNGTCITLLQVRGDRDRLHDLLTAHEAVEEYLLAGDHDAYVYLQSEPNDLTKVLLEVQHDAEIIVKMPLEHTGDGGIRGTVIGADDAFGTFVEMLPEDVEIEVERVGDYHPNYQDVFASLTARQREVLSAAIRLGYYTDPRRTSQQDLADALDVAPGTVSQHLRRIEAKVFSAFTVESSGHTEDA